MGQTADTEDLMRKYEKLFTQKQLLESELVQKTREHVSLTQVGNTAQRKTTPQGTYMTCGTQYATCITHQPPRAPRHESRQSAAEDKEIIEAYERRYRYQEALGNLEIKITDWER
jgi:hypothetical protein